MSSIPHAHLRPLASANVPRPVKNTGTTGGILELTWKFVQVLGVGLLVAPAHLAHDLVAGGQGSDGDEGENEREGGVDVPLAEDDAEVGGVPCEKHLRFRRRRSVVQTGLHGGGC